VKVARRFAVEGALQNLPPNGAGRAVVSVRAAYPLLARQAGPAATRR
jgi:hypothetical protein